MTSDLHHTAAFLTTVHEIRIRDWLIRCKSRRRSEAFENNVVLEGVRRKSRLPRKASLVTTNSLKLQQSRCLKKHRNGKDDDPLHKICSGSTAISKGIVIEGSVAKHVCKMRTLVSSLRNTENENCGKAVRTIPQKLVLVSAVNITLTKYESMGCVRVRGNCCCMAQALQSQHGEGSNEEVAVSAPDQRVPSLVGT